MPNRHGYSSCPHRCACKRLYGSRNENQIAVDCVLLSEDTCQLQTTLRCRNLHHTLSSCCFEGDYSRSHRNTNFFTAHPLLLQPLHDYQSLLKCLLKPVKRHEISDINEGEMGMVRAETIDKRRTKRNHLQACLSSHTHIFRFRVVVSTHKVREGQLPCFRLPAIRSSLSSSVLLSIQAPQTY